jgi:hypothetical protein
MLVAAGVFTTQIERLRARWKLEGGLPPVPGQKVNTPTTTGQQGALPDVPLHWRKQDYRILPDGELGPALQGDTSFKGTFVVYDWGTREIIWQADWGPHIVTPAGYCFADGVMYINDLEGAGIFTVDVTEQPGRLLKRISHPHLNDLHSLERTRRGLLATCSGTDLVIELDLEGNSLFEWWATEHGYTMTPSGQERTSGRGQEHRDQYYHTRYHTTHLNDAVFRDEDERYLLTLLFHQGLLVQIDRALPEAQQRPEVLLDSLARPHGLERVPSGWIFCNTLAKEVLFLDEEMRVVDRIEYDGGWIQSCTMTSHGHVLLNDVDNHHVVEFSGPPWEIIGVTRYPDSWRMGKLLEIAPEYSDGFRRVSAPAAARA